MPPHSSGDGSKFGKYFKKVSTADPMAARNSPKKPTGAVGEPNYSPDARFDFILNPAKKSGQTLSFINNVPRSILIPVVAIVVLFLFIFISTTLNGRKNAWSRQVIDLMAKQTEIIRVTSLAKQKRVLDTNAGSSLDATVLATITSDYSQTNVYMKSRKVKVQPKKLIVYRNTATDSGLAAAGQSNTGDSAYTEYIRAKLTDYQRAIRTTYPLLGSNGQTLLNDYFQSAKVILDNLPPPPQT